MKTIIILIILFCASCMKQVQNSNEPVLKYFYLRNYHDGIDTVEREIIYHKEKDSLIGSRTFKFKGENHQIKMYTTDFYAAVDGGELFYELDSMGIIYSKSTTWFGYSRLYSNNDSINSVINVALENIILYPELHCYNCELISREKVRFIPPKIE